jgi:predicted TIM-barrel fold metal-dependent hydrolase
MTNSSFVDSLIQHLNMHKDHIVIDADTHVTDLDALEGDIKNRLASTPDYYHGRPISAEDLLTEMKMAEVDMSLIWQNPAGIRYTEDKDANYRKLLAANKYIYDSALKYPTRFIPAGWTDPKALGVENAREIVRACITEWGFVIVKMNPAQNAFQMYSKEVIQVMDTIVEMGGVPAFHYGADTPFTPPEDLEKLAERYSDSPILAVHMGGGGAAYPDADPTYIRTRSLGLEKPNLKFILSAKRDTHMESDLITYQFAGLPFKNNIFCASDAPYGRQTWNFGGFRWMFDSLMNGAEHTDPRLRTHPGLFKKEDVNRYMGGNFARFMIDIYEK